MGSIGGTEAAVRAAGRWRALGGSRVARAAAVGAGLGLSWIALAQVSWDPLLPCDHQAEFGCLGAFLLFLGALVLASLLVSWLVLRLVGVRPAWRVAAVAALLFSLAADLGVGLDSWGPPEVVLPVTSAALFACAAALTAPGARLRRTRAVLVTVVLLYWPLVWFFGRPFR
ncbi:hypothetical protein ACWEPB_11680 [Kitasatospora cineracea]